MTDEIEKYRKAQTVLYETGKLKETEPDTFKEFLSGCIVHLMELNLQTMPEPPVVDKLASQLYGLLKSTWPGATRGMVYRTFMHGMAKQGQYGNFRVNYPLLANWVLYHRQIKAPEDTGFEKTAPSLNEQALILIQGLSDYRKRKEATDGGGG